MNSLAWVLTSRICLNGMGGLQIVMYTTKYTVMGGKIKYNKNLLKPT